ncbi:MAG TPA: gas vesicle structural protein GvpA [Actinomycetes bacterium]|nr:gas vesicle structural protein GvpA [Actinomycetes bacterium]
MTVTHGSVYRTPRPSSLADVLDVILDKGIVIDAYVRVAVLGIELLTIDARIVVASVDTYLRFAEAVNRLDLQPQKQVAGLPGLMEEVTEGGAEHKTKGALRGAKETAQDVISSFKGDQGEGENEPRESAEQPSPVPAQTGASRSAPASRQPPDRGGQG